MPAEPIRPEIVENLALPAEVSEGHIADISALPDGRVALLLRDLREVVVLRDGLVERRFGRRGSGPGEFRSPMALVATDSGFAVLDTDAIELFGIDGISLGRARLPWIPDWSLQMFRKPNVFHRAPYQSGPEDVSRRITRFGSDYILFGGERGVSALPPLTGREEYLSLSVLRLSAQTLSVDSLGAVRGPERSLAMVMVTDSRGQPMTNIEQPVSEPLFGARPLVAGTSRWLAIFDPARGRIDVTTLTGGRRRILAWPDVHVLLTDSVRVKAEEWQIRDLIAGAPNEADARLWERNARRATFAEKLRASQAVAMSDTLAPVAAMFASGRCLWLVGTDLRDFSDGTGHWGIAVDVETGETQGPFRLATRESELKDVGFGFAYATRRTEDGEFIVERTPLPVCAE
jgi:hypothetical protein